MKLFKIDYMDDCYDENYLTVGENEAEVKEREIARLIDRGVSLLSFHIKEVAEVDGYKVNLNDISHKEVEPMLLINPEDFVKEIASLGDLRTLSTKTIGEALQKVPKIEAEPVRYATWEFEMDGVHLMNHVFCSACKKHVHYLLAREAVYCSKCGAKMREVEQ